MTRTLLLTLVTLGLTSISGYAQTFDNSGNSLLNGQYFVRWVGFDNLTTTTTIGRARSFIGTVSFNPAGTFSVTGQLSTSTVSSGAPSAFTFTGNYSVGSNGLIQMANPFVSSEILTGGVGVDAFVASTTDSTAILVWDLMIGVPIGSSASNAAVQGNYRFGAIDFTSADVSQVRNYSFLANANGQGSLGNLTVGGHSANQGNTDLSQTVTAATYTANSNTFTFTFPAPGGSLPQNLLVTGSKQCGVSTDGNVIVCGSQNGYDMVVGIKAFSGAANSGSFSGVFYTAGMDDDVTDISSGNNYLDAFYGSVNANGLGTAIAHQRVNPSDNNTYDYTFDDEFTVISDGSVTESFERFYIGAGSQTVVLVGRSTLYSFEFAVAVKTLPQSGSVYLNPVAIVNAATYAPITNSVAPGEFLIAYGTNLATATLTAQSLPLPKNLGGTSVTVNGRPAAIYAVSPGQVVFIVPYATSETYATFMLSNNGTVSNAVTLYTLDSAPGMFTIGQNGIGPGSITHADGSLVNTAHPARVGETVIAYATGLGVVTPAVGDGTAGPSSPLSTTNGPVAMYIDNISGTVTYAGLAPGFASLYQINFVIPSGAGPGDVYVDISTAGGYASLATISVSQ